MDVATTLSNVMRQLDTSKQDIIAKIALEAGEIETLTKQQNEIDEKIDRLTKSLSKSEKKLEELNNTMIQTKTGYDKIIEAGETLLAIVRQNLPDFEEAKHAPVETRVVGNEPNLEAFAKN